MAETIFITGVSRGLGHGLAEYYLKQGAAVFGCSRGVPEDLVSAGLRHVCLDLAGGASGAAQLRKLCEGVDHFDRVILNAAKLGEIRDLKDCSLSDLRETMEINVWANKWIVETVFERVPSVRQVVGISSGASLSGSRGWNGYSLSKAALNMLMQLFSGEYPDTHFTAFAPGLIDTAMQDYLTGLPEDERFSPLAKLKAAKGTEAMPDKDTAARLLAEAFPKLLEYPSGSYADIRKMS